MMNKILNNRGGGASNEALTNKVNEIINNIWDKIYPVNSIYMSVNSTNPSLLFGGQ
ncbi:hypothetical protein [uncultured Clostridium sp.]|uniref:hypothetical protein n=1 Tax=uncultured Clostridium sp. TaxID=59620 RepID=UPI0026ECCF62|nr:hypothetical protein [uncultured Clostridium sp.]